MTQTRHILLILDGYGIAEDPTVSAIDHAQKPFLDHLFATYPHATLEASGEAVGLPAGQMGNSEVGHLNLGAGRIVYQDITRIDRAISEETFFQNPVLQETFREVKAQNKQLHLLGLLSDGGVHSSNQHLYALLELARQQGLAREQVCVHAFTDGRDTDPEGGAGYVADFEAQAAAIGVGQIVSVMGRYYAMDRDRRWPRIERAYRLLVEGKGTVVAAAQAGLQASYDAGITDEFVEPLVIGNPQKHRIQRGDAVVFFNFRADRARQLTRALWDPQFDAFPVMPLGLQYVTFTPYDDDFSCPIAFPKINLADTLGEVVAGHGLRQLRSAETEKYPHVTYFFNGGRETPFSGEDRLLVPSPKVATYDLQPEMSAPELAERVVAALAEEMYDLVVLNFANPDMVGHTGVFEAAVAAVEAVDAATRVVVEAALAHGYSVQLIADHGNADKMRNPDGSPHTAHTTAFVPHLVIREGFTGPVRSGILADIAPTILKILGVPQPATMTGTSLI